MAQTKGILERVFKLSEKGTTVKTEILAGLTTFVAMAKVKPLPCIKVRSTSKVSPKNSWQKSIAN